MSFHVISRLRMLGLKTPAMIFVILVILITQHSPGEAQDSYFSTEPDWISGSLDAVNCTALGDIDQDGDLDLVCGNYAPNYNITIYLNEDGMLCQWFPRYEVTEWGYKVALHTMKDIFPCIYEFDMSKIVPDSYYRSFLILASKKPFDIEQRLRQRISKMESEPEKYHSDLRSLIGLIEKTRHRNNEDLEKYIADVEHLNTDDLPILEFHALKNRFKKFRKD